MKQFLLTIILILTTSLASAKEVDVRSIEKAPLDLRCRFADGQGIERKFSLELSRDHKSLRVFLLDSTSTHQEKVFLARLSRYTYSPSGTHISMSFQNPNQRGNILYVALGVPQRISVANGEQAQHAVIHFMEGNYLTGRCHILFAK